MAGRYAAEGPEAEFEAGSRGRVLRNQLGIKSVREIERRETEALLLTTEVTILYGLRGVGKTVLLNRIRIDAEAREIVAVNMEAPEERSLPALLVPALRAALIRLDRIQAATADVRKALRI